MSEPTLPCSSCGKGISVGWESYTGEIICQECWHKQDKVWDTWEKELTDDGS